MFDRTSQIIKFVITSFVLLIVCSFVVVIIVNIKNKEDKKDENKFVGTTSRRTYKTTSKKTTTTTTTDILFEESTTTTITTSQTTSVPLTTTVTTTKKPTTTTKGGTTKKTTKKTTRKTTTKKTTTKKPTTQAPSVPDNSYTIAYESTTYPLAVDFWEWGVVDLINEERASLGLPSLEVAVELRELAETAADYWYDHSNSVIDEIIGNHNYYGKKLINASYLESYQYLYDTTVSNTDVTTNPYYSWIGVGVIYREVGDTGMRTHYYVIIYE